MKILFVSTRKNSDPTERELYDEPGEGSLLSTMQADILDEEGMSDRDVRTVEVGREALMQEMFDRAAPGRGLLRRRVRLRNAAGRLSTAWRG